tara:strand:+ start:3596 stop:4633 length:1038 start_codon:yes stop_codon:yes gene_type:complete
MGWQDIIGQGANLGANYLLAKSLGGTQRKLGTDAQTKANTLGTDLATASAGTFKPFSVSTGLGPGIDVGQGGGVSVTMPQAQMDVAREIANRGGQNLMSALDPNRLRQEQYRIQGMLQGDGVGQAQQDIYGQLQAMRQPEQERQRLGLEERLFSQGRTGLSTAMYGGSPEQLAMEKAIQEQQSSDSLMARQQALSEQQQQAGLIAQAMGLGSQQQAMQAELGLGGVQAAFLPQQQALNLLSAASPYSELATRAGLQGVVTQGELGMGGLEALTRGYGEAAATERAYLEQLSKDMFGGGENSMFGQIIGGLGGSSKPDFGTVLNTFLGDGLSTTEAAKKAYEFFSK